MKETKGICATDRVGYIILLAILGLFLGVGIWLSFDESTAESTAEALSLVICALFGIGFCGYHLIEQQYLDEEGITVRRFGKSVRFLAWQDVAQVHKIHHQKASVLMVTPSGCPEYSPGDSCDDHLFKCVGQAILLDDSKQNRAYIERVWGTVVLLDFKGYPIEEPKR